MIYIVYKDGSWNETESDLEAAEYAGSKIWLVTIRGNESRRTSRALDFAMCAPEIHRIMDGQGFRYCGYCGNPLSQ